MKTAKLSPCREVKFPDIPDLKFFKTEADLYYFDATGYLKNSKPEDGKNIEHFFTAFAFQIGAIQESNGIGEAALRIHDDAGNEYLEECLALPFMEYVNRWFGPYLIDRMEELIRFGFSVNDNMARFFYEARFEK